MLRAILSLALVTFAAASDAASLSVSVRNPRGIPLRDAVVFALVEGRELPPSRATAIMDQRNRTFVPHVLPIQKGTSVRFPNSDDVRHQVYSFSPAKTFQLPLYVGTPANPIVFDKPGVVTLGCNIHDRMTAYIVVVDTPHFAATTKDGQATLSSLPAGRYVVHAWHPDMTTPSSAVSLTLGATEERPIELVVR